MLVVFLKTLPISILFSYFSLRKSNLDFSLMQLSIEPID